MPKSDTNGSDAEPEHAAVRRLMDRYPDVSDDDLVNLLRHLREEAARRDINLVTSDDAQNSHIRQLYGKHEDARPGPGDKIYAVLAMIALVFLLVCLRALGRAG